MPWETILSLLGMLAVTAAVLALAYLVTRWIGRYGARAPIGGLGDSRLRILRQLRVGRDEQLVLVQLQKRCLLLGITAGGISVLCELTGDEAGEWLAELDRAAGAQPGFWEILQRTWSGKK